MGDPIANLPEPRRGLLSRSRSLSSEVLSWGGIAAGAFTIFSNVTGFIEFAWWVRHAVEFWSENISVFVKLLLSFIGILIPDSYVPIIVSTICMISIGIGARLKSGQPSADIDDRIRNSVVLFMVLGFLGLVTVLYFHYRDALPYNPRFSVVFREFTISADVFGTIFVAILTVLVIAYEFVFSKNIGTYDTAITFFVAMITPGIYPFYTGQLVVAVIICPVLFFFCQPGSLSSRATMFIKVAAVFIFIASLTLIPVPPQLADVGFFRQ